MYALSCFDMFQIFLKIFWPIQVRFDEIVNTWNHKNSDVVITVLIEQQIFKYDLKEISGSIFKYFNIFCTINKL